ncbi:MAG: glycosyltransferase family 2 protein, partial [Promethearchaeota archaeon]
KGEIIVTLDSDGQHDPKEIPILIDPIIKKQADVVIGSRYLGECKYEIPKYTQIGEKFVNLCLWILFKKKVMNNQSGFRAFNRKILKLFSNLYYNKFGICTEIIFKAALYKFKIIEVPIIIYPRKYGNSYINLIKILISILSCITIYSLKKIIKIIIFSN